MPKKIKYGQSRHPRKKNHAEKLRGRLLAGATVASAVFLSAVPAWADISTTALPTGASVVSGAAAVSQSGSSMQVTQTTDRAIINWSSFDIGSNASVNFAQPSSSSVALNRVLSAAPSTINGKLTANGQVWLINPAGVVFGAGANVNVGGLVASTMDIADEDFKSGKAAFSRGSSTGSIVNKGSITVADKGLVALLAPEVVNEGVITARLGTIVLAAGEKVVLGLDSSNGLVAVQVDPAQVKTLVQNKQMVIAESGRVVMSAKAASTLLGSVIKNEGTVEASSISNKGGEIILDGADDITNTGSVLASGTEGGSVKIAASSTGSASVGGVVSAAGSAGQGGAITVTGDKVAAKDHAKLDATGATGGGVIQVGGSWKASDSSIQEATKTTVAASAVLDASAKDKGNGGVIVVRSDITKDQSVTRAFGTFVANGGMNGGNGGKIETSGHFLDVTGAQGSASSPKGTAGLWLFDPYTVEIVDGGSTSASSSTSATGATTISTSSITSLLNGGTDVTITTGTSYGDMGDIVVNGTLSSLTSSRTLTLQASDSITINTAISSSGAFNLNLYADIDHNGTGVILLYNSLTTNGGSIKFGDGTTATINGVSTRVGGDVYVGYVGNNSGNTNATTISTGGGNLTVNGQMIVANPNGISISTSGGNVTFAGMLDSGNTYSLVSSGSIDWSTALTQASNCTIDHSVCGGRVGDSYLATVTSRLEGAVVTMATYYNNAYQAVWLGGQRLVGSSNTTNNAYWRWVAGPEGLVYQSGGYGQVFFAQNGSNSSNGSGGSAYNGSYVNWNSGEPNNSGGANLSVAGESAMQTLGSSGMWNDLPQSGNNLNYYVKETNLSSSPISVNAGAGTVVFGGKVGSNKVLSNLSVTANTIAINGGSMATDGAQTYTGNVTLGSASTTITTNNADFTLGNGYSMTNATGAAATLSIQPSGNITLGTGSSISSSSGTLGVNLVVGSNKSISLGNSSSVSSNGGAITLQGGTVSTAASSTISSNGGVITLQADTITANASSGFSGGGTGQLIVKSLTSGRTVGVGSSATGNLSLSDTFLGTISSSSFALVTFGDSAAGDLNIAGNLTFGNTTKLLTLGNIVLGDNSALNFGSKSLILALAGGSSSSATESSGTVITAGGLLLSGANSTFTLNSGTHHVATLAGNAKIISFINADSLEIGTVNSNYGLTMSGNATIQTTGATSDIAMTQRISSTSGNVVLAAGRNFTNSYGSGAFNLTGFGSNYYVYSANPAATTEGVTVSNKHYNQNYTGTIPTYASSSGSWFFYSIAPTITVNPGLTSISYGTSDPTISGSYSGFIDGDTSSVITGAGSFSIASATLSGAGYRSAGSYALSTTGLGTLANNLGYSFAIGSDSGTLTVTPKDITVSSVTIDNKVYDGSTTASLLSGVLSGVLSGDTVSVSGSADFSDKDVGAGKNVTASGFALSGSGSSNYHVTTTSKATTASITRATLAYAADPVTIYTGFSIPVLTGSITGFKGSDTQANATSGTAVWSTSLSDTNVSGSYAVNGSGLSATNYVFAQAAGNASALTVAAQPKSPPVLTESSEASEKQIQAVSPSTSGTTTGTTPTVVANPGSVNTGSNAHPATGDVSLAPTSAAPAGTTSGPTTGASTGLVLSNTSGGETTTLIIGEGTSVRTTSGGSGTLGAGQATSSTAPAATGSTSTDQASPSGTPAVAPSSARQSGGRATGITIEVLPAASTSGARQVTASVGASSSFSFSLETSSVQKDVGDVKGFLSVARLADGSPLPSWLSYDKESHSFTAAKVPEGGLPVSVRISLIDRLDGTAPARQLELTISR
jgi:filamentous hemagglutinin family protein